MATNRIQSREREILKIQSLRSNQPNWLKLSSLALLERQLRQISPQSQLTNDELVRHSTSIHHLPLNYPATDGLPGALRDLSGPVYTTK